MVTWLPRSLGLIAVGAILAFGIDVTTADVDIHRVGLVLLAVGAFDLLLNVILLSYERAMSAQPPSARQISAAPPPRPHVVDYRHEPYERDEYGRERVRRNAYPTDPRDGRTRSDLPRIRDDRSDAITRPIRRRPPA